MAHEVVIHKDGEYVKNSDVFPEEKVTTNAVENVWRWLKDAMRNGRGTEVEDLKLEVYS